MNVGLIKSIDKSLGPLAILPMMLLKFSRMIKIKKILIIRLWALGDSVITLVMLKALEKAFPKAEIYVLAQDRNRVVYENNPRIKKIYSLGQMRFHDFDLVFDCEPYLNISAIIARYVGKKVVGFNHGFRAKLYDKKIAFNKKQHMVENYLDMIRVLGFKHDTDKLEKLMIKKNDMKLVENVLKKNKIKKIAGLTVGAAESATSSRMWPLDRFAKIGDHLSESGYTVFFVGSPGESAIIEKCQSLMKSKSFASYKFFNISQVIGLIEKCSIFISNDTGPMHIAAAQGVPTIGLFGANTPTLWGPYGKGNISIYHKEKCSPCIDNSRGLMPDCPYDNKCIKAISVDEVKKAIDKIIKN